jgi:hypothetical protein
MADINYYRNANLESPLWDAVAVTPSDAADLPRPFAQITAVGAGNISVIPSGSLAGTAVTMFCPAGGRLHVFVDRVRVTGTTATGIVALYGNSA